jgi:CheY-like chemotaxis protein
MSQTLNRPPLYKGFRFPPEIISHGVWLYYRFGVSLRDVSELLLARGIEVSYEAIRFWTVRFGLEYARRLRRTRGTCSNVEAGDGREPIAQTRVLRPDVILMDVSMPEMDGVEATRHIHAEFPFIQIFGLSTKERIAGLHAIERVGGAGYFIKDANMKRLVEHLLAERAARHGLSEPT